MPKNPIAFAHWVGDHGEKLWRLLGFGRHGHTLPPEEMDAVSPTQAVAVQDARRETIPCMLRLAQKDDGAEQGLGKEGLDEFLPCQDKAVLNMMPHFPVKGITAAVLKDIAEYILRAPGQWLFYNKSGVVRKSLNRFTQDTCKAHTIAAVFYASCVLQVIGLGKVVKTKSTAGGGRPNWFFVKRPVQGSMSLALRAFGIHEGSTPSLRAYSDSILSDNDPPLRAPIVDWDGFVAADASQMHALAFLHPQLEGFVAERQADAGHNAEADGTGVEDDDDEPLAMGAGMSAIPCTQGGAPADHDEDPGFGDDHVSAGFGP